MQKHLNIDKLKLLKNNNRIENEVFLMFILNTERPLLAQVAEHLTIRYKMGQWLPPKAFKDWNDCLLNKPMEPVLSPNKNDRDLNLAGRRNTGIKL